MRQPYQKPGRPRPAQPTAAERMERKRQAKEQRQAKQAVTKYAGLEYNYGQIAEEHREIVQQAALTIRRWQRNTIEIGKTLLAVKELLPHKQFLEWLVIEFGLKERSIQSMMNVARLYGGEEKAQRVALLSAGALYELAAPSTPPEARTAVEGMLEIPGAALTRAEVKRVIRGFKPRRPKQLPAPFPTGQALPQLTGPVAQRAPQPDPDDAIDAEYTVAPAPLSFAEWLAVMPPDLSLAEQLAILALAKTTALHALGDHPKLYNAVYGALPTWSNLIHKIEQELRQ